MSDVPRPILVAPYDGWADALGPLPGAGGSILLVERQALMREWLRAWLRSIGDREVTCLDTLDCAEAAVAIISSAAVILSIGPTTPRSWIGPQIARLHARPPSAPLVLITDASDAVEEILGACAVQAHVTLSSGVTCAAAVLQLILAGGVSCARSALVEYRASAIDTPPGNGQHAFSGVVPKLTERERSVLEQLQYGLSNKIIARELGISHSTVKVHVQNIIRKLKARNRTEAAFISRGAAAARHGTRSGSPT
jgi:DNA-binding NarL/FixJ family response regulator